MQANVRIVAAKDAPRFPLLFNTLGAVWAMLALAVMVSFWQGPYLFNLASPFRLHWVLGLLVVGLPLAVFYPHPKRWVFLALPLAVGMTFLSYFAPRSSRLDPAHSGRARVAVSNILSANQDLARLSAWLAEEKPDIVALTEVTEAHRAQLEALPYAHKTLYPQQSNFGLGLLCQTAPSQVVVLDEGSPFPSLLATWPDFRVLITHPIPPISKGARVAGDEQMQRLTERLKDDASPPLLVLGDLNATGWDLRLQPLREAKMVEARLGHGFLPTWPADRPIFGIPIDHIYLPAGWESLDCRRGPQIGSDHFPLVCDLAWPLKRTP